MKEDILEQIAEDWLLAQKASFCKHNVKFKPSQDSPDFIPREDCVYSDIDILAVHLDKDGPEKVSAVSCKSWQEGFNLNKTLVDLLERPNKRAGSRELWKCFRELVIPKWGKAFARKIYEETRCKDYTYYLLVTKLVWNKGVDNEKAKFAWENCKEFIENLKYDEGSTIKIKVITFNELLQDNFRRNSSKTLEATDLGRLIQIIKASDAIKYLSEFQGNNEVKK